jgi:hypothetical protein
MGYEATSLWSAPSKHLQTVAALMAGQMVEIDRSTAILISSVIARAPELAATIGSFPAAEIDLPPIGGFEGDVLNMPRATADAWMQLLFGAARGDRKLSDVVHQAFVPKYVSIRTDTSETEMLGALHGLTPDALTAIVDALRDGSLQQLLSTRTEQTRETNNGAVLLLKRLLAQEQDGRQADDKETERIRAEAEEARAYFTAAANAARLAGLDDDAIKQINHVVRIGKALVGVAEAIAIYSAGTGNVAGLVVSVAMLAMAFMEESRAEEGVVIQKGIIALSEQIAMLHREIRLHFAVVNLKLDALLGGVAQALKLLAENRASLDSIMVDLASKRDEALELRASMGKWVEILAQHSDEQKRALLHAI